MRKARWGLSSTGQLRALACRKKLQLPLHIYQCLACFAAAALEQGELFDLCSLPTQGLHMGLAIQSQIPSRSVFLGLHAWWVNLQGRPGVQRSPSAHRDLNGGSRSVLTA